MDMAIASASIGMASNQVMGQVNIAMLGKTRDIAEQSSQEMLSTMVPPAPPAGAVGSRVDMRV